MIVAIAAAAVLAPTMAGCTANDSAALEDDAGGGLPGPDASIEFASDGTLTLAPGEKATITVVTAPAERYEISFLLVGDTLDASLSESTVVANDQGEASVDLRAPNSATSFAVRAKIKDGNTADLPVAVSDQGFGALDITPVYNGDRDIADWSAFVVSGKSCEALGTTFPDDPPGALVAGAEQGDPLVVDVAPVGPTLAVFVRSKHIVWGCSDVTNLVAESTTDVEVFIKDRPIDVSDAQLDMALGFEPEEGAFDQILSAAKTELLAGFDGGLPLANALLDNMALASTDATAFAEASTNGDWLTALQSHLASNSVDLGVTLVGWADAGLALEPPQLTGRLEAIPEEPGFAVFELELLGSATPQALGIPSEYVTTITVEPDDTARVGGELSWLPSRYVANAAANQALMQQPNGTTMADVLAAEAACDQLVLAGLAGCDQTCIAQLCTDALGQMWASAVDASAANTNYGELPFQASGASNFDEWANLTGFTGMWLGNVVVGSLSAKVTGAVVADTPLPE